MTRRLTFRILFVAVLAAGASVAFTPLSAILTPVSAQDIGAKLLAGRMGEIEPGQYVAADRIRFILEPYGQRYLLKFADSPEVFVLTADRTSMGGRVLKYDNGGVALQVAGLGGLTLYPDDTPNGLPAVRTGEAPRLVPDSVAYVAFQNAVSQTGRRLNVTVESFWTHFSADAATRSLGLEALQNLERGIHRFTAQYGEAAFTRRVDTIRLEPNMAPKLVIGDKTLTVTFEPTRSFAGRMSSRAFEQELNKLLAPKK